MPAGQSIPFAVTAGTIAGLVVGQLAGKAVKERGGEEVASRLAAVAARGDSYSNRMDCERLGVS
jgi:outer membrane lipoprotein SlyB